MWLQKLKEYSLLSLCCLMRGLVSLRYRIRAEGLASISKEKGKSGILFLPNHPSELDPIFLMLLLWKPFRPHPLVVQYFFEMKGVLPFMKLVRAFSLPSMNGTSNSWKKHQMEKLFQRLATDLDAGENFLIYPAGKLKLQEKESIGGASLVYSLLQQCPNAQVVLVRTTGLWGSSFSRAVTGKVPSLGKTLVRSFIYCLRNCIFFMPRREVLIQFSSSFPATSQFSVRMDLNRYLEDWYNAKPDPLQLVSYTFWKRTIPPIHLSDVGEPIFERREVPRRVRERVIEKLAAISHHSAAEINEESDLSLQLGLDSLDMAHINLFLDDCFDVSGLEPGELQTVDDVLQAAAGRKRETHEVKKLIAWPKERKRQPPGIPEGQTLQEVFLRSCYERSREVACSDGLMEITFRYRKLQTAVLALAMKIREMPDDYIAVLLPSSAGSYIAILAILMANKIPVMLNWTAGTRSLNHVMEVAGSPPVLSVRRFLDKLEHVDLGKAEEKLVFLEEVSEQLTFRQKLQALRLTYYRPETVMKKLGLSRCQASDQAVLLFTSGTESLPKGVPLTHNNILSDQRAVFSLVSFSSADILYAVLPPFHSFGFSITGLLPLFAGLKVCYAPDPTDSHQMAYDVAHWRATTVCATPSFHLGMFRAAKNHQLDSLRLVVSGAEKPSEDLLERIARQTPHALFLEGYGITECSPVVTLNRPGEPVQGVGRPLDGISLCTIDPETKKELPPGEEGEICIQGPNVFSGYYGEAKDPFIELHGSRWYRSGDRGLINENGALILSGRLTRFVKIGAEMVGLGGVEEDLLEIIKEKGWPLPSGDKPHLALSYQETEESKVALVLFTTFPLSCEVMNEALRERGLSRLVKIARVIQVPEIPLTGTGKTSYRTLDEYAKKNPS